MTYLVLLHYYLGIEVDKKTMHIFISLKKYVGELLNKFGMQDCNLVQHQRSIIYSLLQMKVAHLKIQQSTCSLLEV